MNRADVTNLVVFLKLRQEQQLEIRVSQSLAGCLELARLRSLERANLLMLTGDLVQRLHLGELTLKVPERGPLQTP